MGFFPDVIPGQSVDFSAVQENNLRQRLNELDGFRAGVTVSEESGTVRVQVFNAGSGAILQGTPVAFPADAEPSGDVLPAVPVAGADADALFGVCEWTLAAGEIGPCVLMGVARVRLSNGGNGAWLVPDGQGAFARADAGTARLLYDLGSGEAIALVGCAAAVDTYDGPFAISYDAENSQIVVAPGYVSCNGTWRQSAQAALQPQTGTLCCHTALDAAGVWSAPTIVFAMPGKNHYPIGAVKTSGRGVTFRQFHVPVAVFIDAAECPVSAYTNGR